MKTKLIIVMLLTLAMSGSAQERRWNHGINTGVGLLMNDEWDIVTPSVMLKAGYGLNYRFDPHWSVSTGLELMEWAVMGGTSTVLTVPASVNYHFGGEAKRWRVGVGPAATFRDFNDFKLSFRPSVGYQAGKHWELGMESSIFKEAGYIAFIASYQF